MSDLDPTAAPGVERSGREPAFNAPWPIVALPALLLGLYAAQAALMTPAAVEHWSLTGRALAGGRWSVLLTYLFLHGGWAHVAMNSAGILAFGPPSARLFGAGPRGSAAFFAFYLACGVLAGLGFLAVAWGGVDGAVGASGAVSGLMGAAARIIEGRGRIGPIFGRTVLAIAAAWTIVNVLLGVSGLTPGAEGMPVAWQAHLAGFAAGVLLVGPFARLAGLSGAAFTQ